MRKRGRKLLAMSLAASMCVNAFGFQAFADEGSATEEPLVVEGTVVVESSSGGGQEDVDVIISITEKTDGTTETVIKTQEGGDVTNSGLNVEYQETVASGSNALKSESEYTVTNDDDTYSATGGSETTVSKGNGTEGDITMDVFQDGEVQTDITGSSNTANSETTPNNGKDLKEDNPAEYDQTTVTTTDRTADVTVGDIVISTGDPIYVDENGNIVGRTDDGFNYYWSDIYNVLGESIIDGEASNWTTGRVLGYIVNADGTKVLVHKEGVCQRVVAHDNGTPDDSSDDYEVGGLYCVDASTGIKQYLKYRRANLEDATYYSEDDISHLRAIMTYGYTWDDDDDNGITNLANMKAMLRDAKENGDEATKALLKDLDIDKLTREQAATATGMAVWKYGNRYVLEDGQSVEYEYRYNDTNKNIVDTVYKYLLTLTKEAPEDETQVINEEKFIDDMSFTVSNMTEGNANNADDDDTNDVYDVDLKFSLVVEPSKDNDDLVVKVVDGNGNVVRTARIAGQQKENETFGYAKMVTDENGKNYYILEDLQLEENSNTNFNLKLEGTQLLKEGVYIFESEHLSKEETVERLKMAYSEEDLKAEFGIGTKYATVEEYVDYLASIDELDSQNFIGKYEGAAEVDVSMQVNITFNVEEATVTTERIWREEVTKNPNTNPVPDPENGTGTDTGSDPKPMPTPETEPNRAVDVLGASDEIATGVLGAYDEISIPDDMVPLGVLPATGDFSGALLAISLLSSFGFAGVSLVDRKKRK